MSAQAKQHGSGDGDRPQGRKWLGIHFRCCNVYGRLYRDDAGQTYRGQCPRCAAKISVPIGQGGTSRRFFEAS
ncbi:MAG: hypothetical protein KDA20_07535 [Phycisphaerales bacterium]|nr:hypothetical protein [Phycisphaerales bacterium]